MLAGFRLPVADGSGTSAGPIANNPKLQITNRKFSYWLRYVFSLCLRTLRTTEAQAL